ncbi:MAG: HAD-IA family hydrolase [Rubrivivax sp.]|nr:HAD-IA family hydrolase [Rubrivivax sp.]
MRLQALVWDIDGTLAETEEPGHRIAFNRAFEELGLSWRWDSALYGELLRVTGGKERLLAWWLRIDPQAAAAPAAAATVRRLHELKTAHYLALLDSGGIALRPGVQRVLEEAGAQGLRLAIATTTTLDNVTRLLDVTLGAKGAGMFEVIGAGDVVPHKKPAPDIYHWVLQQLALPAEACLAIEDSAAGARAARSAGLPVIVTRSRYTAGEGVGAVLADLDGLGDATTAARGTTAGQAWAGVVGVDVLRAWHGAARR